MIKYLTDFDSKSLSGKKVLLRVDFNVPLTQQSTIGEAFRIKAHKKTIDYLVSNGAKVLLVSHITTIDNFNPIVEGLGILLGQTVTLVPLNEFGAINNLFQVCQVLLLDNIRQNQLEEKNDEGLALSLSKGFDLFINDAFSVSHRRHASVAAITKFLPSYGGLLMKTEVENLSRAITKPAEGKILILGGAKISTKLPVINNFLDKAEKILVSGALANNFFKAKGLEVGVSLVDDLITIDIDNPKIVLPEDFISTEDKSGKDTINYHEKLASIGRIEAIVDVGPKTIDNFEKIISASKMVIWNGPMGIAEIAKFADGTNAIAKAVAGSSHSIIGGGDTITAVDKLDLLDKYSFVSTGGGAMLEFLAGDKLPGLESLGYYD